MKSDRRVLITGSSGMLGVDTSLVLSRQYNVIGLDIKKPPREIEGNFKFFKIDLCDEVNLRKKIEELRPDFLLHLAAFTDVDGCELDPEKAYLYNHEVPKNIARVCADIGIKLFFISTDFVFDGEKNSAYVETDKTNALSVYGKSKLKAEQDIQRICGEYYIFRTAWLFGKWGKNFVRTIANKALSGEGLKVVDDQKGCPTYTKDLAFALSEFVNGICGGKAFDAGIYHLVNSGNCSWYNYAKTIVDEIKAKVEVKPISSREINRPAHRPEYSVLNCTKFEKSVGLRLRSWQEALRDYLEEEGFLS